MGNSVVDLAQEILDDVREPEILRIYDFPTDEEAHDDALTQRLYAEFSSDLDRAQEELSKRFGAPMRTGQDDVGTIPIGGIFRFALWSVGDEQLYIAAAHEDRGVPILLVLGKVE